MSRDTSSWLIEALAVFAKEWRCELRTRYALNTLGLFAVTTLVVMSISLGPLGVEKVKGDLVLPVLLWILLLFAVAAGLPRAFVHEEESRTAIGLRLSARPSSLFCGKLAYSFSVVLLLELIVTPLFASLMQLKVENKPLLFFALVTGGFGLAAGGTLVASIIAQARGSATLFSVLALPVLLPLLKLAIEATQSAVAGETSFVITQQLLLYDGSVMIAGLLLFPAVWNP
ncbi:MAG: heme exporter protein CcmB [Acidobacteria bacterium]|nr:heme exporter protein CcmB [Acidobacteriota bacterium]